jgi:D-lactate dehydrogenase
MENVILTPHMAFDSVEAVERILQTTVDNILAFEKNSPQFVVGDE